MQTQFNRVKPSITKYSKTMVPKIVAIINNISTIGLSFEFIIVFLKYTWSCARTNASGF
jgi:hypothetical protein